MSLFQRPSRINGLPYLQKLPQLLIPRPYFPCSQVSTKFDHIIVFADASTKAYGAVVYLNSNDHVCLAMSKICLQATSLPRLELMAAATATRLTDLVRSSLPHDRQAVTVYFWTDSQIVLHWILKGTNPKLFIYHRVKEIHDTFRTAPWSFTPSADNPPDLLTRGLPTTKLKSSHLWTHGYLTNLIGQHGHL